VSGGNLPFESRLFLQKQIYNLMKVIFIGLRLITNEDLKMSPWWNNDQNIKVKIGSKYCVGMKTVESDIKRIFTVNCFKGNMFALCEKLS
jgi:hypothetical protein